jgi:hypothetical protein
MSDNMVKWDAIVHKNARTNDRGTNLLQVSLLAYGSEGIVPTPFNRVTAVPHWSSHRTCEGVEAVGQQTRVVYALETANDGVLHTFRGPDGFAPKRVEAAPGAKRHPGNVFGGCYEA